MVEESSCQNRRSKRLGFNPWVSKIPRRRKWQSTPVFLPGESHGQRSLGVYSPWGCKELDTQAWAGTQAHPTFSTLLDSIINSHSVSKEQSCLKLVWCAPRLSTLPWGKGMGPVQPCVPRAHYRSGVEPRGWRKKQEKMRLREEGTESAGVRQIP